MESSSATPGQLTSARPGPSTATAVVAPDATTGASAQPSYFWRWASNLAAIVARNVVSVGVPTALRELGRRGVAAPLLHAAGPPASYVAGSVAALLPAAYQIGGIYRDASAGTQTVTSLSSRVANIMLLGSTFTALAATGHLAAAAPALVGANLIYTPLRDLLQYGWRLSDNNPGLSLPATAVAAGLYGVNQTLVSEGMERAASILRPYLGELGAQALGRAAVNVLGETADELAFRGMTNVLANDQPLRITLAARSRGDYTMASALDQLLNTHAGRSTLFASAFSMAYATQLEGWPGHGAVGATLAAGYLPFIYTHDRAPAAAPPVQELGFPLLEMRRASTSSDDHVAHSLDTPRSSLALIETPPVAPATGGPPVEVAATGALAGLGSAAAAPPQWLTQGVAPTAPAGEAARAALTLTPGAPPLAPAGPVISSARVPDAAAAQVATAVPAQAADVAQRAASPEWIQAVSNFQARYAHLEPGSAARVR